MHFQFFFFSLIGNLKILKFFKLLKLLLVSYVQYNVFNYDTKVASMFRITVHFNIPLTRGNLKVAGCFRLHSTRFTYPGSTRDTWAPQAGQKLNPAFKLIFFNL